MDPVLHVVDAVGDVVGPVHDLGLERPPSGGAPRAHPVEHRQVVGVHAELAAVRGARPGVLGRGVQGSPGEVQAHRALMAEAFRVAERLGLEPGQDPQRLGVALEAADVRAQGVERVLAVMAERGVAEVVGEAGGLHEVGVAAQGGSQLPPDLGHLQGVGHPGAGEVALAGDHHLGLGGQPSPGGAVQDTGAVARVGRAAWALGWFVSPALLIGGGVSGHGHAPTVGVSGAHRQCGDAHVVGGSRARGRQPDARSG